MRRILLLLLVTHTHAAPLDPQIEQRELHNKAHVDHFCAAWAESHGWIPPDVVGAPNYDCKLPEAQCGPGKGCGSSCTCDKFRVDPSEPCNCAKATCSAKMYPQNVSLGAPNYVCPLPVDPCGDHGGCPSSCTCDKFRWDPSEPCLCEKTYCSGALGAPNYICPLPVAQCGEDKGCPSSCTCDKFHVDPSEPCYCAKATCS